MAEQIQNIGEAVSNFKFQISNSSQVVYPPIEESVPVETPVALQGWDIMSVKPVGEVALSQIESDVVFFTDKIPQFEKALSDLGIDVNKISDIQKVAGVELYMPGLTELAMNSPQIIAENNFSGGSAIPLVGLSLKAKQNIPSDIVFARTGGELIDYKIGIFVNKQGQVELKLNIVLGKPMELVIKPDQPAKRVTGYIFLKKTTIGQEKSQNKILGFISRISGAALIASMQNTALQKPDESLLVNKFAYTELDSGIFTASVLSPQNEGEYEISTVIEYKDILIDPKETKMTVIVNPEGYVYSQTSGGRLRIEGATVSLYWLNPPTDSGQVSKYELWPADKFLQKNPIITDETGKYSFLVPKGIYKLKVAALNYKDHESNLFEMKEEIAVSQNIELKKKLGLAGVLNWQNVVVTMLFVVIVLLGVIIIFFVKRSRK